MHQMKNVKTSPTIPGPKNNRFYGPFVAESRRDPLGFMTRLARTFGDVCSFRIGFEHVFFVNHPEYIHEILVNHYDHFLKGRGLSRSKHFIGEGLLLSEGEKHRRHRRLSQPAFHRNRIAAYAEVMADYCDRTSSRWRDGEVVDVWPEMQRLTLGVTGKTLFSADVESEFDEVGQAMMASTHQFRAFKLPLSSLLERLPLPHIFKFHRGKERLRQIVLRIIHERRRSGEARGDLLGMLIEAEDENDHGARLSSLQVWDQALTFFIAGYDTIATALMWTWFLLSQNPLIASRLHAEVDHVLTSGESATFDDLPKLRYTENVLAEAMRLYPPTWRLVRRSLKEFPLNGYVIPPGALVMVSQYVMHRDPRYFPDPEVFDPERFNPEAKAARPSFSYFPFGGGARRCLGEAFAMMEGVLLLASLARRWELELLPTHRVEPYPEHLLRSKHGMVMRLKRR